MKLKNLFSLAAVAVSLLLVAVLPGFAGGPAVTVDSVPAVTLPDGAVRTYSAAQKIDDLGNIAGVVEYKLAGAETTSVWFYDHKTGKNTIIGEGQQVYGLVNGEVMYLAGNGSSGHTVIWYRATGKTISIDTPGGTIQGESLDGQTLYGNTADGKPYLSAQGETTPLTGLPEYSFIAGVNNKGKAVFTMYGGTYIKCLVLSPGATKPSDMGSKIGKNCSTWAVGISDSGLIGYYSSPDLGYGAFDYVDGNIVFLKGLGTLADADSLTSLCDINQKGNIVGAVLSTNGSGGQWAVAWPKGYSRPIDLSTYVPGAIAALCINGKNEVVVVGTFGTLSVIKNAL